MIANMPLPDLHAWEAEEKRVHKSRGRCGPMAERFGLSTSVYNPPEAAVHATAVLELFKDVFITLLDRDSQMVRATESAVASIGGEAIAYKNVFSAVGDRIVQEIAREVGDRMRERSLVKRGREGVTGGDEEARAPSRLRTEV